MENKITYEALAASLKERNYAEVPFAVHPEVLQRAALHFLEFLELPQGVKDDFTVIADPNDRGSDSGYARRKQEEGRSDNKEFFNYRRVTEELLREKIAAHSSYPAVRNFLRFARQVRVEGMCALAQMVNVLEDRHPGISGKVFAKDPGRLISLRFVKYDRGNPGDTIAKAHYDRGFCALALAESAPGLRIGSDAANLREVVRTGNTAIFMPAKTFARDLDANEFKPAWHDVVQKDGRTLNDPVARWAIILFADVHSDNSISYEDTHTVRK